MAMPAMGRSKCLQPIRQRPTTSPLWASTASTRDTMTCAGSCLSEGAARRLDGRLTATFRRVFGRREGRLILPPVGSAGFRAAPSSTGRLTVSASSRPRIPTERQISPAVFRLAPAAGRRDRPRSSRHRTSQNAEPDEEPDEGRPRGVGLVAHDQHHPGYQDEEEQEVEVADAPDTAELEEEGQAAQERQEEPDLRFQAKIGNE